MRKVSRDAIFISHANPEDNAFTIWLGSRLTAAGYEVWADVLGLHGGQDWQRRLEDSLRNRACKILLVGTEHGVKKQGVRNELQIAHEVGQRINDADFIIPLRLTNFDAPFLIAHAQYIDFKKSWADGLAELLETLKESHSVARKRDSASETMDYWKQVHLRHAQSLTAKPEPLVSNWLSIERLPETIYLYAFRGEVSLAAAKLQMRPVRWPIVPFRQGFLAFCPTHDVQDYIGLTLSPPIVDEIRTVKFLDRGWPGQDIDKFDAHNQFSNLIRQAMEFTLRGRSLTSYEMASEQQAWWGEVDSVPSGQITFSWEGGLSGRRQILGYSKKRRLYWHYGITPKPRVSPFPHVQIVSRVIFTENGHTPIDNPKRMHALRRSFTKSWRNAKWRDMLLAFLHWLGVGNTSLVIPVGSDISLSLRLPPVTLSAPVSIVLDDDDVEDFDTEDDLITDYEAAVDIDKLEDDGGRKTQRIKTTSRETMTREGAIVTTDPTPKLEVKHIAEPQLEFAFGQKLEYPRDGLYLYGPASSEASISEVRYGVIGTGAGVRRFREWSRMVSGFIGIPEATVRSRKIQPQHVPFPGFEQAFAAKWSAKPTETISDINNIELQNTLRVRNRYESIKSVVGMYVERLIAAQDRLEDPPSFWFVVIPEEVYALGRPQSRIPRAERIHGQVTISASRARKLAIQPTLFGEEEKQAEVYKYAVHFRRQLKARLLKDRIVTQIVRETTLTPDEFVTENGRPLRRLEDPATVAWKLCTGAYYKAGGRPWQLADVRPGVCYVGLVYKRINPQNDDRHACCAAQMFLSDGDGVVFRGALGPWYSPDTRQYHLDLSNAQKLIQMVAKEYRRLHGKAPTELFIHARSAFTEDEWRGFERGCPRGTNLVGVQIRDAREGLKLFRTGKYPVIRGTAAILTKRSAFLWTTGYVPRLDTYMGPETPNPIQIKVQKGRCALETVLSDILGLTKINFNSCLFNDHLPVTIKFADAVGAVLVSAPIDGEPKLPFKYYI